MNNDQFEKHLSEQPFRPMPAAWKEPILTAAREAAAGATRDRRAWGVWAGSWTCRWREWLWPHPLAWAALTALWLVAGLVNWSTREPPQRLVRQAPSAPPEAMLILQEQQRRWENLVAAWRGDPRDAAKPVPPSKPRPRSHSYENLLHHVG